MNIYFLGVGILVFCAILQLFCKNQSAKLKVISSGAILGSVFTTFASVKTMFLGASELVVNVGSVFSNVGFTLDNLSAFFAIIISIMSTLAIIYANGYLKPYIDKGKNISAHCLFLMLLMSSMLGVVVSQNALSFLIIWEFFVPIWL